jgi:hypothetical protein
MWHFCSSTYTCDVSVPRLTHVTFLFLDLHMWHFCSSTYTCEVSVPWLTHVTFLFLDLHMWHFCSSTYTCDVSVPWLTHVTFLFLDLHMWHNQCWIFRIVGNKVVDFYVTWRIISVIFFMYSKFQSVLSAVNNVTYSFD